MNFLILFSTNAQIPNPLNSLNPCNRPWSKLNQLVQLKNKHVLSNFDWPFHTNFFRLPDLAGEKRHLGLPSKPSLMALARLVNASTLTYTLFTPLSQW